MKIPLVFSRLGDLRIRVPFLRAALERVPARCRPTLLLDSLYNVGSGAQVSLFLLSMVVLKTVLNGNVKHLALLGAMFGGSSLLSPLVSYAGRSIPMRSLVVFPNLLVAACLIATAAPHSTATWFTLMVGLAFIVRVFPRVAEMNMYRVLYPPTCRGAAVGWVKAIAAVSGLAVTLLGYWWFGYQREWYWMLYVLVAAMLLVAAICYMKIPISRRNIFARGESIAPHHAFREGLRVFLTDRRFMLYQFGFFFAGAANHMVFIFVPEVLKEHLHASDSAIRFIAAVLPALLITSCAPVWGRYLDRVNPMIGRATFNALQCGAFALFAYGGLTLQLAPFVAGSVLHGLSNGGSTINWLTGSLYFARSEQISLYNAVHVGLTGIRGMTAPLLGLYLFSASGLNLGAHVFWIAAFLSLCGAALMLYQGVSDPGPREIATAELPEKIKPVLSGVNKG